MNVKQCLYEGHIIENLGDDVRVWTAQKLIFFKKVNELLVTTEN